MYVPGESRPWSPEEENDGRRNTTRPQPPTYSGEGSSLRPSPDPSGEHKIGNTDLMNTTLGRLDRVYFGCTNHSAQVRHGLPPQPIERRVSNEVTCIAVLAPRHPYRRVRSSLLCMVLFTGISNKDLFAWIHFPRDKKNPLD